MEKKELRTLIKTLKKQHTKEQLFEQSEKILSKLEQHPDFVNAHSVMLYSALPDEVQTQAFLEKWHLKKHPCRIWQGHHLRHRRLQHP